MLGRLEMSVDECIQAYSTMSREVFKTKWYKTRIGPTGEVQGRFDTQRLEQEIRKIVEAKTGQENTLLKVDGKAKCKVCVAVLTLQVLHS